MYFFCFLQRMAVMTTNCPIQSPNPGPSQLGELRHVTQNICASDYALVNGDNDNYVICVRVCMCTHASVSNKYF